MCILFVDIIFDVLGLKQLEKKSDNNEKLSELVELMLNMRMEAKANKDWATSDKIRDELQNLGFIIKDKKDGFDWELK